jgi:tetratricopeptide (TPR) repeat protein
MNKINTMAYSEAIVDFERAIELDSAAGVTKGVLTPSSYNNMALAALNNRDFSSAIKYCDEAIRINSKTYTAYAMRANILAMQGNYNSALNDATQAKTLMVESGITSGMHLQGINHLIYNLKKRLNN